MAQQQGHRNEKNRPFLGPMRMCFLIGYTIVLALLSADLLIILVDKAPLKPKEAKEASPSESKVKEASPSESKVKEVPPSESKVKEASPSESKVKEVPPSESKLVSMLLAVVDKLTPSKSELVMMLLTIMVAGILGGTLCGLSGLFTTLLAKDGRFPISFEIPFYIRPWTGLVTGLLIFFVGNLLVNSLAVNAGDRSWEFLEGRLPYIAIAIIAGFASQEFIERLKATAHTLFAEDAEAARYAKLEEVIPELEKLADMKANNLLDDEELKNLRKQVFDRLKPPPNSSQST